MATIENPISGETWTNFKHRTDYQIVGIASDATSEMAGLPVVIYIDKSDASMYVRDLPEFKQKFFKKGSL